MPSELTDGIHTFGYADPASGRQITRLHFRGWFVDVDGTSISVPRQRITAAHSPVDLDTCLAAARHLIRQNTPPSPRSVTPPHQPASAGEALTAVLRTAHDIAGARWQRNTFDIYDCTSAAWAETGMTVAYTAVLKTLRRALPPCSRLIDVNDNARTCEDICNLYLRAIALVGSSATAIRGVA